MLAEQAETYTVGFPSLCLSFFFLAIIWFQEKNLEDQLESMKEEVSLDSQKEPLAMVKGSPLAQLPLDLYVPPDALEVIIRAFEGPLDLPLSSI